MVSFENLWYGWETYKTQTTACGVVLDEGAMFSLLEAMLILKFEMVVIQKEETVFAKWRSRSRDGN
jgi:hypothetical protein